jgi:hypothetical protein
LQSVHRSDIAGAGSAAVEAEGKAEEGRWPCRAGAGKEETKTNMNPQEFLASMENILQHRRIAFERAAAIAFVESCWELIEDEPDVWFWSERFVEAGGVEVPSVNS